MVSRGLKGIKLLPNEELYSSVLNRYFKLYKEIPMMPLMLRYAWHDAGTYDKNTGTGGPNASLVYQRELMHGANAGLQKAQEQVLKIKKEFNEVSLADLIQAAGYAGVEFCNGPKMKFRFGRVDVDESHIPEEGRLPDATQGVQHLRDIFYRMGFDDKEIVALSGGHTLGKAMKERSGFEGKWTDNHLTFDNSYFVELMTKEPKKHLLRLPTDEALLTEPSFAEWVEKFAKSNELFLEEYSKAHVKLSELGYE
mmetsp:Transcript_5627/g.8372  ORF Transcript_5627/g.8372 Transcript_5627/m.8372 type:complete len:253 (+) Transcript_5627:453-1211(+)